MMILLALVSTFTGIALIIDRPKDSVLELFAPPFLAIGGAVFAWAVWPRIVGPTTTRRSIASRLLQRFTFGGRLIPLFPALGVGIILADLAYNVLLSASPALQTEDTIVLLAASYLLAYGFIPSQVARERDFVLVFFFFLNVILVFPLLAARALVSGFQGSVDMYSWVALAPETSAILNLLGVASSVHSVPGSTAPGLTFQPRNLSFPVTVVITTACSGIYSFGIFASAFIAFVATEFERGSRRIWALFCLGFSASYLANVLRMVVIVLVGYFTDTVQTDLQNMLVAHSYTGWIIFLAWLGLFWTALLRFSPLKERSGNSTLKENGKLATQRGMCRICGRALSPAIPAGRCSCGALFHEACLLLQEFCPSCARRPEADSELGPRQISPPTRESL